FSVVHLPDIIAKMTVSGSGRGSSSCARAGIAMKAMASAKACRQNFMIMPRLIGHGALCDQSLAGFSEGCHGKIALFCSAKRQSEIERRVVDHFLHDEEGPGLADARQRDQLFAMDAVEILHVADPDLEEIVEIAGHQV